MESVAADVTQKLLINRFRKALPVFTCFSTAVLVEQTLHTPVF